MISKKYGQCHCIDAILSVQIFITYYEVSLNVLLNRIVRIKLLYTNFENGLHFIKEQLYQMYSKSYVEV